ncbi:hypothetical protein HK102_006366 [Quaeritorhiza haematococci]|nr:hypothetical protein HK102_006366 [Quaeritorhiza haematococci]
MNAFIIYRLEKHNELYDDLHKQGYSNNKISQFIGEMWRKEPEERRQAYYDEAMKRKEEHGMMHPDYKFSPRKDKKKRRSSTKATDGSVSDASSVSSRKSSRTNSIVSSPCPSPSLKPASRVSSLRFQPYMSPMSSPSYTASPAWTCASSTMSPMPSPLELPLVEPFMTPLSVPVTTEGLTWDAVTAASTDLMALESMFSEEFSQMPSNSFVF